MIGIPLKSGAQYADHTFVIQLGDNLVSFRQLYRTLLGQWMLSASIDDVPLFDGVMLEPFGNLTQAWNIEQTFGALILMGESPTLDNIGIANTLVWVAPNE